jgi:hypothetical protein
MSVDDIQGLRTPPAQLLADARLPRALLAATSLLSCLAAAASTATWEDFWRLAGSSLLVHTLVGEVPVLAATSALLAAWDAAAAPRRQSLPWWVPAPFNQLLLRLSACVAPAWHLAIHLQHGWLFR